MRITNIRTHQLHAVRRNYLFVQVETDAGLTGLGEATLEQWESTVEAGVHQLKPLLIGEDPTRIEHLFRSMCTRPFWRGGAAMVSAISGIEIALWDIRGQSLGVPIYELLGGRVRDRVRAYCHVGATTPAEAAELALARVAGGWTAMKMTPLTVDANDIFDETVAVRRAVAIVHAVRDAVGPNVDIMLDGHGRFTPAMALYFTDGVKECWPYFFEEPEVPNDDQSLAWIRAKSPIPLATGERRFGRGEFAPIIANGWVDFVQPDPCHAGGIMEVKKIGAMAEPHGIRLTPHNPLSPVCTLVGLHLGACCPNHAIQETAWYGVPWWFDILDNPPTFSQGYLELPSGPGLGAKLREDVVRAHPPKYSPPADWRSPDGALVEW